MKVGTDSVLLGAWCDVAGAHHALDVGTGCGIIALMLAQRSSKLTVDAIDIDSDSVVEASENFSACSWSDRLNACEGDFNTIEFTKRYDLIVSNPPFFTNGVLPPEVARKNARHTQTLNYRQLLTRAKSLLADAGKIAIVSPVEVSKEILEVCHDINLNISHYIGVVPVRNVTVKRVLWEFTKLSTETRSDMLVIRDVDGEYTSDYKELCREFYLKF